MTTALCPYLVLGAPVAGVEFAVGRRWIVAIAAAALSVVTIATQLPRYVGSDGGTDNSVKVRMMSANLRLGTAEPDAVVRSAQDRADVLAVQEFTPDKVARLSAAGLQQTFPYRALVARDSASGVGIWSRYPIQHSARVSASKKALVSAQLQVTGVAVDPTVVVVHTSPWPEPIDDWSRDMDRLSGTLEEVAKLASGGSVIVAGDFNSTADMRGFRQLLHNGYHDSSEQAGAGMTATFPADVLLPSFLGIDHILTYECTATSVHTLTVPGSDHRAVVADIELPRISTYL